ncbi:MAG TPA: cytochrome c, partial [Solirubrobacteraceae bacterium]|nr:cytochrome c [Solirubrobacteraceae bacterium]
MRQLLRAWLRRPARTPRSLRIALAALSATGALVAFAGGQAQSAGVLRPAGSPATTTATGASGRLAAQGGPPTNVPNAPRKAPFAPAAGEETASTPSSPPLLAEGRALYETGCSACHGIALQGRTNVAPSLIGVGAGPPDFYLKTGRMPLENPRVEPLEAPPHYSPHQIAALVAFVASHGGPPAPDAD